MPYYTVAVVAVLALLWPVRVHAQFSLCEEGSSLLVVNANEAYAWSSSFPQSCQCEQTGVSSSACAHFDCTCICDLTAGKCDYNCCCDSECSAAEISRFEALGACLEEGPAPSNVVECYSGDQLKEINPSFPMSTYSTAETALDNLLCVQYDNSNNKGDYYDDPGTFSASIFSDSVATTEYSYTTYLSGQPQGATEGDATFDLGDRIPSAFFDEDVGMVSAFGGYMPIPIGDNSGQCNENNFVQFEVPIEGNVCERRTPTSDLEAVCSTLFGGWRFSKDLYIGTDGSVTPTSDVVYVPVDVVTVMYEDYNTSTLSDFQGDYNCDAYYYSGNVTSSSTNWNCTLPSGLKIKDYADSNFTTVNLNQNVHVNTNNASVTTTTTTTTTTTAVVAANSANVNYAVTNSTYVGCHNALRSVCYTIVHDVDGNIVQVQADVVLTDVPITAAGEDGMVGITQEFRVQFQSTADVARSTDLGNYVNRTRSGNPGYDVGKPVLVGNLIDNTYIAAPVEGMTMMKGASDGGLCGSGDDPTDVDYLTTVSFAYDVMSCCLLSLTRSELQDMCNGNSEYVEADGFTPAAFAYNMQQTYVGLYGNADPLDPSQWMQISLSTGTDTSSWNEQTGTCSNQVVSQNINLLYATVGAKANPQSKIVAAEAVYTKDNWMWTAEDTSTQNFMLCSTVTFIRYDEEATQYSSPPPPVGLQMPWDVFYPFDIASAAQPSVRSMMMMSRLTVVMTLLLTSLLLWGSVQ